MKQALLARKHEYFSAFNWIQSLLYNFLTLASWAYTRGAVSDPALLALREPGEGNPAVIRDRAGALISQDLASSILEMSAMCDSLCAPVRWCSNWVPDMAEMPMQCSPRGRESSM